MRFTKLFVAVLRSLLIAALLLAYQPRLVNAQSGAIRFETLSVEHGLSQSTVRAVAQDSLGFLWFGTDDGLNKYDGYTFTVYKHDLENPDTLSDSTINAVLSDSRSNLWVGTNSGLDLFLPETETFLHILPDPAAPPDSTSHTVTAIVEDEQAVLWVATNESGLYRIEPPAQDQDLKITRFQHNSLVPSSLISNSVNALAVDQQAGLWIGTSEGLDFFNQETGQFIHYRNDPRSSSSLSDDVVLSVFQDRLGILWVGTEEGGLNRFNQAAGTFIHFESRSNNPYTLASNFVRTIYEDQNGRLWVGGRGGLNQFNRREEYFTRYRHDPVDQHSLSNDYVLSIFGDSSGVLWIGTLGGGLSKYVQSNERFTLYQHRPGVPNTLNNDIVHAIHEDSEGLVWVGTMDGGLNLLDPETGTFSAFQNSPLDLTSLGSNDVRAIFEDHLDVLWVGTFGGGLNRFNPETGRFRRFIHQSNNPYSLSDNRVMAIFEDSRGNLWIGTRNGGLELFNRENSRFTHFRNDPADPNSISGDYVRTMYEDRSGSLWVGTYSGISVMDPSTRRFTRFQNDPNNPDSLSNDRVLSILETKDGTIWVGTLLGGLNRFDRSTGVFRHYTQKQGLPSDAIYGILADADGFLWLSTNKGLSRFDPKSETFRNYDRRDGLQSYEFNPGAYFQNNRGKMYFGGVQGFNAFDPDKVPDNPIAPPVVITAFKKFNQIERKDLVGQEKITLSFQENFISFEFAALDYSAPEKNQYAYKLEGFDKDWVFAGTRRYASYTNLRGGNYVFRVIGSNQDGLWNETGASVEIAVIPPIWERWWFIGSVAVILVGGSLIGYRLRLMRMQAQTRQLEKQVHDRTKEIERRREVAEGLREIIAILNSNRSLKESLDSIIRQIVRLLEAQSVIIFRCGEENFPMIIASNLPEHTAALNGRGIPILPAWVTLPILQGQTLSLRDLPGEQIVRPETKGSPFDAYGAMLAVPLGVIDHNDGGLVLLFQQPRVLTDEDVQMALSFADHAALAIANAHLRSQAEEIAVSAERSRLARDLHDAVTQTLFATSLIAEVLPRLWERNPDAGKQKINEIRELTRGALAEMRTLLMELRPTALEDVPLHDLLQQLCEAFTGRARVPVEREVSHLLALPFNVKIGFYRIAQEALNNIQKHARAAQVYLRLWETDERVTMEIQDDGIGFQPGHTSPDHFGLGIMEERAQSIGAQFVVESTPGEGTIIRVVWLKSDV